MKKVITDWDIVKVSASSDTLKLEGAQFTLKDSNGNVRYTGTSNANGKIEWKEKGVAVSTWHRALMNSRRQKHRRVIL
ncbi:MAG: collagen binding domain-containing protein [Eubacterium ramulus]